MKRTNRTLPAAVLATVLAVTGGLVITATAEGAAARGTINADKLDGMNSTAFAYAKGKTHAFDFESAAYDVDENGQDDVLLAYAECPAGTQLTGGGGGDFTVTGIYLLSMPVEGEGWVFGVWIAEGSGEDPAGAIGSILCYHPHGKVVAGSYRPRTARPVPDAAMRLVREAVDARGR